MQVLPSVVAAIASSLASPPHAATDLWAHPDVAGSLQAAVAAAAAISEVATIHLAPGVHTLPHPLVLGAQHSGTHFVGHGAATISGGVPVGAPVHPDGGKPIHGWAVVPDRPAKCAGCAGQIWRASVPKGSFSRQFYVNGVRANRTWAPFPAGGAKAAMGNVITIPGTALQAFTFNVSAIELVYRGASSAGSQWQESRCPVSAIANSSSDLATAKANECAADYCPGSECPQDPPTGSPINRSSCGGGVSPCVCTKALPVCVGYVYDHHWGTCMPKGTPQPPAPAPVHGHTAVTVAPLCAYNGNIKIGGSQPLRLPAFLENIKELLGHETLGHPGDYYLDAPAGEIYYVPHTGETPAETVGQLPVTEQLVQGAGAHDLLFENLAFQHSTWMGASGAYGFVDVQGGWTLHCKQGDPCSKGSGSGPGEARETPAALQVRTRCASFPALRLQSHPSYLNDTVSNKLG